MDKVSLHSRPSVWRILLKYGVPLIVTIGLCYILFTGVDVKEMMRIIRTDCNFAWIAAGLALSILSHVIRALRWQIQLNALDVRPPTAIIILSIFGTYAVNLILPRLGELWRTGYIAERQKAPFSTIFGSMICDRLSDTITVFLILLLTLGVAHPQIMSYLQQNPEMYTRITAILSSPWLWLTLPVLVIAAVAVCRLYPDNRFIAGIKKLIAGIWQGFAVIAAMKGKVKWLIYTILLWSCYFFQLYLAFFAFPATAQVVTDYGITAVLVCFVLSSISMAVPSNGGIGPYQWALMFGLSMYASGIPALTREYAGSFANLVMGCNTLLLILLGIITFIAVSIDKRRNNKPTTAPHGQS
ncbi:MAG: flippase-like domain-containing protein [Muribaculaceae bacterium]|nr:flippase-like domain-containing protein [Muribaculaceae bacterium]